MRMPIPGLVSALRPASVPGPITAWRATMCAVAAAATAAGLATLGAAGTASAASSAPREKTPLPLTAWVATQQGVVPISIATNKPGRKITPNGSEPAYDMVASRNGKTIYDATDNTVSLISAATHRVTRQVPIHSGEPENMVLSPNGRTLYALSATASTGSSRSAPPPASPAGKSGSGASRATW